MRDELNQMVNNIVAGLVWVLDKVLTFIDKVVKQ